MKKTVTALIAAFVAVLIALPLDTAFAGRGGGHGGGGHGGGGHGGGHMSGGHGGHVGGHGGGRHTGGHAGSYRGHASHSYRGHYTRGHHYAYKNYHHGKYHRYGSYYSWGYWPGIYAGSSYGYRRCYSPVYGWYPCSYRYYGYNY